MTIDEAKTELNELRGFAAKGGLAVVRGRIDALYFEICGKHLRNCKCKNVEEDALAEIYARLRTTETKGIKTMAKARLVNGVVLQWKGYHYTNANITDDIARDFLTAFPQRSDWFSVLPEDEASSIDTSEVDDSVAEETKDESPAPAKKKRKVNRKRRSK